MLIGNGGHAKVILSFWTEPQELCIVAVGTNEHRKREAEAYQGRFGIAIHPTAWIAPDVEIGEGTVVMAGVVVQPGVKIGKHVILNTNSSCDHGCQIGDYAHIAPGATLCGDV